MVTLEAGPDTLILSKNYVRTLEQDLRAADARVEHVERQLLLEERKTEQVTEAAADQIGALQVQADLKVAARKSIDDMEWRRRFRILLGVAALLIALAFEIGLHWDQVRGLWQ